VACECGFTVPLRVAACSEIPVAATVVVVGGGGGASPPPPPPQADRKNAVSSDRTKNPVFRRNLIESSFSLAGSLPKSILGDDPDYPFFRANAYTSFIGNW
jgi:hypothetical protein